MMMTEATMKAAAPGDVNLKVSGEETDTHAYIYI